MKQIEQAQQNPPVYFRHHKQPTTIQSLYRTARHMANTFSVSTEATTALGRI
jgi:hypothetical protein